MSKTSRTLVTMPATAKKNEIIDIRIIVQHDMETGFRHSEQGVRIARDIIREFVCAYNGVEIFRADLYPAIAANPMVTFSTVAVESGVLEFSWKGDNDYASSTTSKITVT
ncbi:MAG: thiosulfate oxidation carrier complex protein SoxZ [Sheuella sp.]|nr:thiosulfate oxidation carrier complex protein SoxZ [Sheuella sp.]